MYQWESLRLTHLSLQCVDALDLASKIGVSQRQLGERGGKDRAGVKVSTEDQSS